MWVSEHYANERIEAAINAVPLISGVRVSEVDKFPPVPTGKNGQFIFKSSFVFGGYKIPDFGDVEFKIKNRGSFERTINGVGGLVEAYVNWNECVLTLRGTPYSKTVYFASRYDKK